MSASDEPRQTVRRFLDAVLSGSAPAATDSLVVDPGLRQKVNALRAAFPDLSVSSQVVVADGPTVGVHLAVRGTHRGIFQGVPATGRAWAATCTAIYRVDGGQIVEAWETWDLLGILEQIGGVARAASASA